MKNDILRGLICPYCGGETVFTDSAEIYRGVSYGMIYLCRPCMAYCGVHKGTNMSLGRIADKDLREAKKQAHYWFDQIAKTGKKGTRQNAYRWLASKMGREEELTHIGMFDIDECMEVVDISRKFLENTKQKKQIL